MSEAGRSIIRGLKDAVAFSKGDFRRGRITFVRVSESFDLGKTRVPKRVNVKRIRGRLGLTQAAFASRFGFSVSAIRDWEQGRRAPEAATRVLLAVIDREPEAVLRALAG
jgi:putative transcriptional regulator